MIMKNRLSKLLEVVIFIFPAVILLLIFVIIPAVKTLSLAFLNAEGQFIGLQNFREVLLSNDIINLDRFPTKSPPWGALIHNGLWIAIHLPSVVALGMILAVILRDAWGGKVIKSIIFLGMITPMVVGGGIVTFIFDERSGVVNGILRFLGQDQWIRSILLWTGFSLILYSSGLSTIPQEWYEAAEVDGANSIQKFFYITVPSLKPVTITVVSMSLLWELKVFDMVYTATGGGPGGSSTVLALRMYSLAFRALDPNRSAVIATLLTVLTLAIGLLLVRSTNKIQE